MNDFVKRAIVSLEALSALKKTGMLNPLTARTLLSAHLKKDPSHELGMIENAVLLSKIFGSPFENPDTSVSGPIGLAVSENNQLIGMFPHECHCLIAGQTGCGKSTLLKIIFSQSLSLNSVLNAQFSNMDKIICWLFAKAQDMRSLLTVERDILVVTFDMIKLNPLEPPPGIKATEWASIFADLWIQAFRLYEGSKGFLIECLNKLYIKYSSAL